MTEVDVEIPTLRTHAKIAPDERRLVPGDTDAAPLSSLPIGKSEASHPVEYTTHIEERHDRQGERLIERVEVHERPTYLEIGHRRDRSDEPILVIPAKRPDPAEPLPVVVRKGEIVHREERCARGLHGVDDAAGEDEIGQPREGAIEDARRYRHPHIVER